MTDEDDRYDSGAVVRAVNLPVGSEGAGFSVGRAEGEKGDGTLTGTVGAAVEISSYVDAILDAVRALGVDESQYSDLPEIPRRRDDREEGVDYRPVVAHVEVDTDADPDDPDAIRVDLTDEGESRIT